MIGAMPAVAVRHERRKKNKAGGILLISSDGGDGRPSQLLLKPQKDGSTAVAVGKGTIGSDGGVLSNSGSPHGSNLPSRAGTPTPAAAVIAAAAAADPTHTVTHFRYGDECFYGKVSLLHFIIFFFLGGLTLTIVGAVQFKKEAGLSSFRFHFLFAGALLITVGLVLMVVKCVWFRRAYPVIVMEMPPPQACSTTTGHGNNGNGKDGGPNKASAAAAAEAEPHIKVDLCDEKDEEKKGPPTKSP